MLSTNVFNELFVKITLLRSVMKQILTGVYIQVWSYIASSNAVYFRIFIDLILINPQGTAEGFDGSHHRGMPNGYSHIFALSSL